MALRRACAPRYLLFYVSLQVFVVFAARDLSQDDQVLQRNFANEAVQQTETVVDQEEARKPPFDPLVVSSVLTNFRNTEAAGCGDAIAVTVTVQRDVILEVIADLFIERQDSGKKVLLCQGPGWSQVAQMQVGIVQGPLLKVNGKIPQTGFSTLAKLQAFIEKQPSGDLKITYDAGIDLRNCWANLHDDADRPVCGDDVLEDLIEDVKKEPPKMDSLGKSGSTIVTNLPGFIVKNVKDEEEFQLTREVMPDFGRRILDSFRQHGGCYRTGLAPICAVLDVPRDTGALPWIIMRKIEINGEGTTIKFDDDSLRMQDLKGPAFSGLKDGKSFFGSEENWHRKDAGFVRMFPQGLELDDCGSREAAFILQQDVELLKANDMTDYSLYGAYYKDENTCKCDPSGPPRFPMVLDAVAKRGKEMVNIRFVVGIIDYIERSVSAFEKTLGVSMSTRLVPDEYAHVWMKMWPAYFRLPELSLSDDGEVQGELDRTLERLKVGQSVIALQTVRWKGGSDSFKSKFGSRVRINMAIKGEKNKCYFVTEPSGGKYKVRAGARGLIVSLLACSKKGENAPIVRWDDGSCSGGCEGNKIFQVSPEHIMGI